MSDIRYKSRGMLKSIQYFLMRHAHPLSSLEKSQFATGPRVFANSIPKAGTNLLKRLLNLLPDVAERWTYHYDEFYGNIYRQLDCLRKGQVMTAHMPWSAELSAYLRSHDIKVLFMVRDLRDVAWSNVPYVLKDRSHLLHDYFRRLGNDRDRLMASIVGVEGKLLPGGKRSPSWGEHAEGYMGWLTDPESLVVRFEDLIGSAGGGDDAHQLETVRKVAEHLGLEYSESEIIGLAQKVFHSGSRTFRKGQIGDWRNHFDESHKEAFKNSAGQALIAMGYEKDGNW